jgi:hypothetical protein
MTESAHAPDSVSSGIKQGLLRAEQTFGIRTSPDWTELRFDYPNKGKARLGSSLIELEKNLKRLTTTHHLGPRTASYLAEFLAVATVARVAHKESPPDLKVLDSTMGLWKDLFNDISGR